MGWWGETVDGVSAVAFDEKMAVNQKERSGRYVSGVQTRGHTGPLRDRHANTKPSISARHDTPCDVICSTAQR